MFKKTLISLAVASSVGLSGCLDDGSSGKNANPDYDITDTTIDRSLVRPLYNPNPLVSDAEFPINSDLILLLGASQSANFDFTGTSSGTSPADDAVRRLGGFSTSGAFNVRFDGSLDPNTVALNQTVFLLPLNVKPAVASAPNALPPTNPSGINSDNPFSTDPDVQPNVRVEVVSLDGGQNNAIRIVPLEPLAEDQKFLVTVTTGVKGANGKPIDRAVQDKALADGELGNPALGTVKTLLQSLDSLGNGFLKARGIPGSSAISYTFTTNSEMDVLRAMTAPAAAIPSDANGATYLTALGQKIAFTAQLKAVRDNYPTLNFSELTAKLAELGEKAAKLQADPSYANSLTTQELQAITALGQAQAIQPNIEAAITSQVATTIHVPQPRPSFFYPSEPASTLATIQGIAATDPGNSIVAAATQVRVSQGAIALPYFQQLPGDGGAGIVNGSWTGSTDLEANLNDELTGGGSPIFQFLRDTDGKLNVNGYFPFPQQRATVTVPIVAYHPAIEDSGTPQPERPASCVDANLPNGVTIFQHGITVDRSVSMLPGILLANQACQTVIAIDQPLHGLAGDSAGTVAGLDPLDSQALKNTVNAVISGGVPQQTEDALKALINADYIGERHFYYTANSQLQPVEANLSSVSSGSLFINPLNMANSRDNLRQGVVDLLNVAASTQTFALDGTAGVLAGSEVNFVGHSLGGISGTTFASLSNNTVLNATLNGLYDQNPATASFDYPAMFSVSLHNTGGQVTRLIENSPALSSRILGGLAAQGVSQGSADFENFFYIFQSVMDSTDPVSFAKDLGTSTRNILISEVVGDDTVPNEANVNPLGNAFSAPLAGTEPLMALIDLGSEGNSGILANGTGVSLVTSNSSANQGALPAASFFAGDNPCADANHGTFVGPQTQADPEDLRCPGGSNTVAAFAEMVRQTALTINDVPVLTTTAPGNVANLNVLGSSDTVENALDQDE
ncbi:hypothetical protein RE428_19320 [Marinobacter nanhaiticus D15-8W]|uniref:MECDP-synthase n=1 Tax=Marinobacter nanhaiticus D15-8W TaxID=626887 RepID=N6VTR3_9GAMM|nr:MECDP-synthase [Marinobacter nanhaiticus]ENO13545.1 MECDP-synthase [Marinobacter nanhaiticus D15-8W]BES70914.1 hypothetical protein RE428_19320 [Marinobacter nanhaiticus D15-8W]